MESYNTQVCWAPKLRHKSLHAPSERVRSATMPYTYPPPSSEYGESKTQVFDDTTPPNCCVGCKKVLCGQVLTTATNKFWHSHCFQCQQCHIHLEHIEYFEQDGMPYCALDFHERFSPRCEYCKTPIEADCKIIALGKPYHVGHAFCRECGNPFEEDDRIIEKDGYGFCEDDYNKLFAKTCKGCGEYILKGFIKALGGEWHADCFVCVDCGSKFDTLTFKVKGGKPHCGKKECQQKKTDDQNQEKTCHGCQKPILGRCNSAFGRYYHPIHFQCSSCEKVLSAKLTGLFERANEDEIICKACIRRK